ncbi:MAG TPA: hypothetical protein VFE52_07605, partial [Devosia sp.]|nr:hypothetical protein [Devosia sp.]
MKRLTRWAVAGVLVAAAGTAPVALLAQSEAPPDASSSSADPSAPGGAPGWIQQPVVDSETQL